MGRRLVPVRRADIPPSAEKSGYSTANNPLSGTEAVPSPPPAYKREIVPITASKRSPVPTETIAFPTYRRPVIRPPAKADAPANTKTVGNIQRSGASALTMRDDRPISRRSHVSSPPIVPAAKHAAADAFLSLCFFIHVILSAFLRRLRRNLDKEYVLREKNMPLRKLFRKLCLTNRSNNAIILGTCFLTQSA